MPNTVTVTWDPSASEQWEKNLYYTVLKRESQKGLWHVLGDLIYNNKFTFTRVVPGRDYYFRVVAKNDVGASDPSETVQPWRIWKKKGKAFSTISLCCVSFIASNTPSSHGSLLLGIFSCPEQECTEIP